ncbi:tetratricopeptide repeat protein [Micromonospora sp. NBS 11-29]|uniref:tetratricopeptide repeat protein n=1 Tax=Micromonospora sp. NBS 11-29 TaxID=1960879 RepID=UPI000B785B98|nr:tetratricopeptide repeat protein [Micromonospora sp. NBS 11-29]
MPEDDAALSAEEELALARLALGEGDLRHAADHVAAALVRSPTLPEAHETLARLAAASGGDLDLFPLGQHAFVGAVVARAHLLAAAGRPAEGLDLLAAATGYAPASPWAAVPWVTAADLPERLDPERTARILMQVCAATGDPVPRRLREPLLPYLTLARNAITVHPTHPLLLGAASALARRLGEVALAVTWATRGVRAEPTKLGEVWLGYAYRSAGRTADALAALERAVALDPDDLAVYADIAGTLADHGRLDAALEWVDRALAKDPTFDCAVHTAHRLRFQRDGNVDHLVALADFVRDHPDDTHEHGDLDECCRGRPWLGQVTPAGADAPAPAANTARPSASAERRLQQLAHPAWAHPPAAYDAAVGLATLDLADLLGLMAYPPDAPPTALGRVLGDQDPALWTRCAQVWACLGLLHHRTDEPWAESTRRRVLGGLAGGEPGPIAEAALFALVTAAWVDPAVRADVAGVVAGRLAEVESGRARRTTSAVSLAHLARATPALDPATRATADALVAAAGSGMLRRLWRRLTAALLRRA